MKRNKFNKNDFTTNSLPSTRKEQFKDILKTNYRTIFRLGLLMLIFSIPILVFYFFKNATISSVIKSYLDGKITIDEEVNLLNSSYLFLDLIETACLIIFFIGISGTFRVLRVMAWEQGLFLWNDFKVGIKSNFKKYFIFSLFTGALIFAIDLCGTSLYALTDKANIINIIIMIILFSLVIPIILYMLAQYNYYDNSFSSTFTNSFRLTIIEFKNNILFSLCFLIFYLLSFISIGLVTIGIFVLLILFILPIYLLAWNQFSLHVFDKFINEILGIKDKGLYVKNEIVK